MKDHSLFLAQVVMIYPHGKQESVEHNNEFFSELQVDTYTIDVKPFTPRTNLTNVKVLVPNSGSGENGFGWMPSIGSTVVCGYLEGFKGYAICLGNIYNSTFDRPSGRLNGNDYLVHHQTGSIIHIKDLEKIDNLESNKTRAEISIEHPQGSVIKITEPSQGKSVIDLIHSSGTNFRIDEEGNLNIKTDKIVTIESSSTKVLADEVILGSEQQASPILSQRFWPIDTFTGSPIQGIPTVRGG